ncbi:PGF-CTERM sorting domain-containing protein [Natrononativus amylolyticus]|uniref:PGF-CTERM sorting domain-containing protein n=1 Tax=Natrononativus amylolyticus TaxID=2963434 RepID=UPI0020CC656E|nr:PGF-CTERM sorting domain-containing protein [Natrononativus amylolyticus]
MSTQRTSIRNRVLVIVTLCTLLTGPVAVVSASGGALADDANATEEPYLEDVPEEGDEYFEMEDPDGEWISYLNPRDWYRDPMAGDGSGKICVTLLNEEGEFIVGETVPETTATIDTGDPLDWHPDANPVVVEFPLTEHYDRPLDADQFGTTDDSPQGDGSLDSHCVEWHGLEDDATIEYTDVEIAGEHADRIEVVGYVQQANEAWDTDVDPLEDAVPYEEVGGWSYQTEDSHGQVVVVLQLQSGDGDRSQPAGETSFADRMPGFGPLAALAAVGVALIGALARRRR